MPQCERPLNHHPRCTATWSSVASSTASRISPHPSSHQRRRVAPCAVSTNSSRAPSALVRDSRSRTLLWLSQVASCDRLPLPCRLFYHLDTNHYSTTPLLHIVACTRKRTKDMNFEPQCGLGNTVEAGSAQSCKDQSEGREAHAPKRIPPLEYFA